MRRSRATADSWPIKPMPAQHAIVEIDGTYSREEVAMMSMGFIPQSQADRWFVFFADGWLSFHRSATGTNIFRLQLEAEGDDYRAARFIANRDPDQYRGSDDAYDLQLLSHLIDRLLLGRFSPFPQLKSLSAEDQTRHKQLVMGDDDATIDLGTFTNGSKQ